MLSFALIGFVFFIALCFLWVTIWHKIPDCRFKNIVDKIGHRFIYIYAVLLLCTMVVVNHQQQVNIVGQDKVIVENVCLSPTNTNNNHNVSGIYYNKTNDEYYVLKDNFFRFWNMYDKETVTKEFAEIQKEYHQKITSMT